MIDGQINVARQSVGASSQINSSTPTLGIPNTSEGDLISNAKPSLQGHHSQFAQFHETYVSRYIALADTKASLIFGISSGLTAFFVNKDVLRQVLLSPKLDPGFVLLITTLLLLVTSALCGFLVVSPRLRSSVPKGIVFFASVATFPTGNDFSQEISRRTESELIDERLRHCFELSIVCARKYDFLRRAMWLALCGITSGFFVFLRVL